MNKKKLIILLPVVVVAGMMTYRFVENGLQDDPTVVRVSGNIETTDVQVSFKIAGRVESRPVSEGEVVQNSEVVAQLDSQELGQEVALRQADLEAAQAALAELLAGSRPEEIREARGAEAKAEAWLAELLAGSRPQDIAAQQASIQRAKAEADRLRSEHERQKTLFERDVISAREFEIARAGYDVAGARVREEEERLKLLLEGPRQEQITQARAALQQARERLALVEKGPRQETIDQARARLEQVRQSLAVAETRLTYATVVAPLTGVVLSENVEPGMYVSPGTPVVTVGDLENVWLRTYINETDLGRVKVGQRVAVTTDTYPDKHYDGRVSFISSQAEFTPKTVQTEKERVKLVYRIKVDIPNPNMELKPGMPADAEILVDEWPGSVQSQSLKPEDRREIRLDDTRTPHQDTSRNRSPRAVQEHRNCALNEILRPTPGCVTSGPAPSQDQSQFHGLLLAREVSNAGY